ncbi:hypothetical protein PF008_g2374 [Phytophthora fragariae]|uniref:Uncharacterized protein n=1 Tax=Phytophthora fragariae TaxID=53985 RepID=A0A6G0SHL0_9STRA|nr:hypothetical protein PF008_g2374 [Phytophthora fragariae]
MEVQLKRQFEADCAGVRAQALKFVAKTSADNEGLNRRVKKLEAQVKGLRKRNNVLKEEKTQTNYLSIDLTNSEHARCGNRRGVVAEGDQGLQANPWRTWRCCARSQFSSPRRAYQRGPYLSRIIVSVLLVVSLPDDAG